MAATTTLGSYQLGEVLGRGAMGEVHRAVRNGSVEQIAVKVLRPELAADPELIARFLQERSILCGLEHPNLVRVHDLVVAAGATNVVWVWDVEGITTSRWFGLYRKFWPGTSYVDWIAWDPYNFASCRNRPWKSFDAIVAPFYDWLERQPFGKRPLMLAEYGTIGNGAGRETKQRWYAQEASTLSAFPAIKSLVYFDYPSPPASCDWVSNSSPAATVAFAALAHNRAFQATGRLTPDLATPRSR